MNLDPRSALLNTELALVIHNKTIAEQAALTLRARRAAASGAIASSWRRRMSSRG